MTALASWPSRLALTYRRRRVARATLADPWQESASDTVIHK
jgi:hypothetical protein